MWPKCHVMEGLPVAKPPRSPRGAGLPGLAKSFIDKGLGSEHFLPVRLVRQLQFAWLTLIPPARRAGFFSPLRGRKGKKVTGTFCAKHPKGRWRQKMPVTFSPLELPAYQLPLSLASPK